MSSIIEGNIFGSIISLSKNGNNKPNFIVKKGKDILCEEHVRSFPVPDCDCGKQQDCKCAKKGSRLYKIIFHNYNGSLFSSVFEEYYFESEDSDFSIQLDKNKSKKGTFRDIIHFGANGRGQHPTIIAIFK